MYPYTISFIVPALNEEKVVGKFIDQVIGKTAGQFEAFEIILVNDGSADSTGTVMEDAARRHANIRVLHNPQNTGFGSAFQRGLSEARFEYVMLLCGDGGFPAASLPPVFQMIGSADMVVPWMVNLRELKTRSRYLLSRIYTIALNLMFGLRLHYYNGLAVHRRELLEKMHITSNGFGFQAEMLIKLIKSGYTFVEVGVHGANGKGRSFAMRLDNWLSVGRTVLHLVKEAKPALPKPDTPPASRATGKPFEQPAQDK